MTSVGHLHAPDQNLQLLDKRSVTVSLIFSICASHLMIFFSFHVFLLVYDVLLLIYNGSDVFLYWSKSTCKFSLRSLGSWEWDFYSDFFKRYWLAEQTE